MTKAMHVPKRQPSVHIDRLLHEPGRFLIASQLYKLGTVTMPFLCRETELTWGNLWSHLAKLEEAGYLTIQRKSVENRRHATLQLTDKGKVALEAYGHHMEVALGQLPVSGPSDTRKLAGKPNRLGALCKKRRSALLTNTPEGSPAIASILGRLPLFADLSQKQLSQLSQIAVRCQVRSREYLFFEGDSFDRFYIIAAGTVKCLIHSPLGRDYIIGFYGPGETLGNMDLLSGQPHAFSAQAASDATLLNIKSNDFMSFVSSYPDLALSIFREMLVVIRSRHANTTRRLIDLVAQKSESRLAYTLSSLSVEFGRALPFTREELGQMAGTTTETAIRFVSRLKQEGIVRGAGRELVVLDQTRLGLLAEGHLQTSSGK